MRVIAPPSSTGVSAFCDAEHEQVEHDRQQHAQPARDDDVGAELDVGEDRLAEAARAGQERPARSGRPWS